mgnify:CR=1 FL=1
MKVIIMTDLEGISGVDTMDMVSEVGTEGHQFALERLMADVNAAVEGAFEGGATEVYVEDGHGGGKNFIKEILHPKAVQTDSAGWNELIRSGQIDAYMEVGAHAMPGTINGFLDHVQSSKAWYNYIVNGRKCGEIAQGAIFAGAFDVPFIMVTGDQAACTEARMFLGDIPCAAVKRGVGRNKAVSMDLDAALVEIKKAAYEGMKCIGSVKPYKPLMPMEIILELYRSDMCDAIMTRCKDVERMDARSVRKIVTKVEYYKDVLFT